MADKIVVNTEALQDIAMRLNRLASELTDEGNRVQHASRMPDYCGNRTAPNRCRLQAVSYSCGGRTIEDSLVSYSHGLKKVSLYVRRLARDVQRVGEHFADMEQDIMQLVDRGLPQGLGAALGIAAQFADAPILGPGGQMDVGLDAARAFAETSETAIQLEPGLNIGESFQTVLDRLKQFVEEAVRKARESAQKYADANKLRIFDSEGQYGADQGSPRKDKARYDMYRDIIRENTGKELKTDQEVYDYLNAMNKEGCSYSAMVNAIFLAYEGRAEDFERDFGFPMYHNGDLDYDRLYVDVYSNSDNYNKVNGKFVYNPDDESGASIYDTEDRMEKYLSEHGVDCKVKNKVKITPQNYAKYAKNGSVHIAVGQPFYMYDSQGNQIKRDGGHRMTITGVENGRYVVSSWGKTYYVDPGDPHGYMNFQVISIES